MAFRTAALLTNIEITTPAKAQLDHLEAIILANEASNKKTFFEKIDSSLKEIKIGDATEIGYCASIITEFKSEWSLETIASIIKSAMETLNDIVEPIVVIPKTNQEIIDSYVQMINTVSEAAKTSSTAAENLKFSTNRLSPGILFFLMASSVCINKNDSFGKEAVTSTGIFYRLMLSIDDVQNQAAFDALQIDKENYSKMKTLQTALLDDLANGKIDFTTWEKLDAAYANAVNQIKQRIDQNPLNPNKTRSVSGLSNSSFNQKLVKESITKLSAMGDEIVQVAIQKSKERLARLYF